MISKADKMLHTVEVGMKLKAVMKKKGLFRAKAPCPDCKGMLHGALQGRKQHLHMRCDGTCGMLMME